MSLYSPSPKLEKLLSQPDLQMLKLCILAMPKEDVFNLLEELTSFKYSSHTTTGAARESLLDEVLRLNQVKLKFEIRVPTGVDTQRSVSAFPS